MIRREIPKKLAALVFLGLSLPALAGDPGPGGGWPRYRGPGARGIAGGQDPPTTWNVESKVNIRWKAPIPGLGHASPIVWGNRVFLATAVSGDPKTPLRVGLYGDIQPVENETTNSWRVYCLDLRTGRVLWERTACEGIPKIKRHPKSSHANSTPATDGSRLVAFFGSEGLYCYDLDGKLLWKKDLGLLEASFFRVPSAQWGFGSSPIIYGDLVIVQCDVLKNSFLAALDVRTGEERWRTPRSDVPTWSTPTVHEGARRVEVLVNGYRHAGGYDPLTGKELWKLSGGGDIPVPTPFVANDLIFLSSAHGSAAPLRAIRPGASGDISLRGDSTSSEYMAWCRKRDGVYLQTPIVYGEHLYACRGNGVLSCYNARTGERIYRHRLGRGDTGFSPSPVAAGGKIYFTSEEGDVFVIQAGPGFNLLATNPMGELCMATPAIADSMLLIRTRSQLFAVGK
jgi:outer membrane protein assembly factor BamB